MRPQLKFFSVGEIVKNLPRVTIGPKIIRSWLVIKTQDEKKNK
jgi:hypothetical protein